MKKEFKHENIPFFKKNLLRLIEIHQKLSEHIRNLAQLVRILQNLEFEKSVCLTGYINMVFYVDRDFCSAL